MPGTLFDTDTSFPRFTGNETDSEKIQKLQDYLYQLTENFRYLMSNLGIENFNATELEELGTTIRKPVLLDIEKKSQKTEEAINNIKVNIGNDIDEIQTEVSTVKNGVKANSSSIRQNSKMLAFIVEEKEIDGESKLVLTPNCLSLAVEDDENGSRLVLTSNGVVLDGSAIDLDGFVTFTDLEGTGQTTINGAVITTGKLYASEIYGTLVAKSGNGYGQGTISGANIESTHVKNQTGRTGKVVFYTKATSNTSDLLRDLVASIYYDDTGDGSSDQTKDRLFIQTFKGSALKMISDAGMSFEGKKVFIVAEGAPNGAVSEIDMKAPKIDIFGEDIYLTGNVYVNGKLIS